MGAPAAATHAAARVTRRTRAAVPELRQQYGLTPVPVPRPRETHAPTAPWRSPGPILVAEQARTARYPGTCALCPHGIEPGDRTARLPDSGEAVHVACAAKTAGVAR